jgi:hypothetical protein
MLPMQQCRWQSRPQDLYKCSNNMQPTRDNTPNTNAQANMLLLVQGRHCPSDRGRNTCQPVFHVAIPALTCR